ncbi:MAG: double-strand break repair helicase AddA, partial [Pseudomonadota bacterium]
MNKAFKVDTLTQNRQATASDPRSSAWVGANAGSGKTFVLARRVVRLLLAGAEPSKILCLTFTKAAAAEMSGRVFATLGKWATMPDAALRDEIADLTNGVPSDAALNKARQLFAKALETPGGLKIQTIHAFCERLLHQFPVEANVAGHFEVLDDVAKAHLMAAAERAVLLDAADNPQGRIAAALSNAIAHASDSGYKDALSAYLQNARKITDWLGAAGGVDGAITGLKARFGLGSNDTVAGLEEQMLSSPHMDDPYLESLQAELLASSPSFQKMGALIVTTRSLVSREERLAAWLSYFFTDKGTERKVSGMASKETRDVFTDFEDRVTNEQARLSELIDRKAAVKTVDATEALLTLGAAIAEGYQTEKAARGLMDFDDLIEKAAELLERPDAAAWVHYKLDQGLDHILVDEAQDTSPRQWDVVKHLADEFFTGESARLSSRTVFAVGDEKQSIYSFQGASPEWFATMEKHFSGKASDAGKPFEKVALSLSFRSTADVLGAVDLVCRVEPVSGLLTEGDYTPHTAARLNQPGHVELWQPFAKPEKAEHDGEWWRPLDSPTSEIVALADHIADAIQAMLEAGERLAGTGEVITAGDILILARKRGGQVDAINRALKTRGISVAGSDRLKLMDNIAVLDLLALTDFVLLSEDDLALAGVLKGPLIGLSEEALFDLSHDRTGTLWNELYIRARKGDAVFAKAHETLDRWRREADFVPPYDFFLRVLSRDRARQAFLGQLGRETDEVLEAFLIEVQTFEQNNVPTLQGFASWFRNGAVEIKRDMETARDEVRVMTVHGAKGLEAPVVFLVDGGQPYSNNHQPDILGLGDNGAAPFIWKRTNEDRTNAQKQSVEREKEAALAEYHRLLYVAMTRARDRLYVATTASAKGEPVKGGWFDTIFKALTADEDHCQTVSDEAGNPLLWRWQKSADKPFAPVENAIALHEPYRPPAWLNQNVSPASVGPVRLTPSHSGEATDRVELVDNGGADDDPLSGV